MKNNTEAFIINPVLPNTLIQDPKETMNEMVNLCLNLNIQVLGKKIINIRKINASTLIGKGTLNKILNQVSKNKLNLLICNCSLTPNQQRNLENYLKIKVVDRSGIIIEIFAKRALSNEGKMQVQLAEMNYRKSRLVRAWTHLERQRGGTSFVGGPGELQIELDRRLIQEKIDKIKRKLKSVAKRRFIQRKSRIKNNFKIFALVGYTNAGKTKLFNRLTKANQKSVNKLFSTLDTKISKVFINSNTIVGLIDTVGFINNIPTQLIESFKATFEEIHQADFIINVVDISDKNYKNKIKNTLETLKEMKIDENKINNILTVYNKIDLINRKPDLINGRSYLSAISGKGIDLLKVSMKNSLT
ncbi:GTPase HflX [Pelagibacteraceae bacterium]|nr:GTPase HflX [Pelagibacteraceae bacterium]